ncbi:MAG: class I SAM-dependent methyltransferase [Bacteroidales bacterium]|nr:class I SAM-dependent methyltransferase [Bacteroidales bacterium]
MSFLKYNFPENLDSPERTLKHKEIIRSKGFLRKLYIDWYKIFQNELKELPPGKVIELGSGGGFLKEIEPSVIATDILPLPTNDLTFSALDMPFGDSELSGIVMLDTFHHIPDTEGFLKEAYRVLKINGKIVMIEPANSWWGRFIYIKLHHEPFDPEGDWQIPAQGPMSGANGALPWIVFERDTNKFHKLFPDFKIEEIKYHTPFSYLLSGGVSYKSFLPAFLYRLVRIIDWVSSLVTRQLSMFVTIMIYKTAKSEFK